MTKVLMMKNLSILYSKNIEEVIPFFITLVNLFIKKS